MNCSSGIGVVRSRREGAILWAILIAALGVRLAYLYQAVDTPLFDVLLIDSEFYDRRARAIVAGDWLGDQPFFMNPFYSYFLAAIYTLLGVEYWWVGLVQAALGMGSCYLIYALGRKLWSAQIGLLAAGMAAIYQPYVFYDGALLTAAPITFLNLAALYCLAHAQGAARWLWGAGLLLGVFGYGAAHGLAVCRSSRWLVCRAVGTARLAAVGIGGRGLRPRSRRGGLPQLSRRRGVAADHVFSRDELLRGQPFSRPTAFTRKSISCPVPSRTWSARRLSARPRRARAGN